MKQEPHHRAAQISDAAFEVDRGLTQIDAAFDFLLYVSPCNVEDEWRRFEASAEETPAPVFRYSPLPFDPALLKRRLFNLPVEDIEDPDLGVLFDQKRDELDRQITLLEDRDTPKFKRGAEQLYGDVPDDLVRLAEVILDETATSRPSGGECISGREMAALAREEIRAYQAVDPTFKARVEISDKVIAGMMVSDDKVLISSDVQFRRSRVETLLQHEIGTHLLTYYNGLAQPLKTFSQGLAGYESLQEGLAVMAEWVTGGLEARRLRTLAARVVAVEAMLKNAAFGDTFQILHKKWNFSRQGAFHIAARVHRGGGFPKDAVYLEGLQQIRERLLGPLDRRLFFVGKIAFSHLPIVERLLARGVLEQPRLMPRYFSRPGADDEFERIAHLSLLQMAAETC